MPGFPFARDFPPPPTENRDLESFTALEQSLQTEPPIALQPVDACSGPFIEISLADVTGLTPIPGAAYTLSVDGRELTGTLDDKGAARIDHETLTLEDRSIRVTFFPEPEDGVSYRIELGPAVADDEPAEEPVERLDLYDIPWRPFGEPEPAPDEEEELDEEA